MNIRVLPILLVCYLLLPDSSLGQNCSCIDCPGVASAFSSTTYDFVLQDAINNDLSNANQGICQIIVQFAPEHIWSLEMTVTSPGGQTITIIGPSSNQFGFTGPLPWEISFIPCAETADPDPGFFPTWNNNQNWLAGDFYNGSYYPFSGCLEDFNIGPVNGNWTLTVNNTSPVNTANIVNFTVIPCDPAGIPCFDCEAVGSTLEEDDVPQDLCQGEEDLFFNLNPDWIDLPDSSLYSYAYLISREDIIIQVDSLLDLRNLDYGEYEICGLSYRITDSLRLPDPTDQPTLTELRTELAGIYNIFCAELSENCVSINIIGHDTTDLIRTRCEGDIFSFIDTIISTPGIYFRNLESSLNCDSIVRLDIDFLPDRDTIIQERICPGSSYLFAGDLISTSGIYFHDTLTNAGCDSIIELRLRIIQQPTSVLDTVLCFGEEINIGDSTYNSSGNYNVIIDSNDPCDSLVILNLVVLNPVPEIENSIFLNCANNPIQISADNSQGMNLSFQWVDVDNGGLGIISDPYQSRVDIGLGGTYNLIVVDSLDGVGCSQMATTTVISDFTLPEVSVSTPSLSCRNTSGQIDVVPISTITNYSWEGPNGFTSALQEPIINDPGSYELFITGTNGCVDSMTYIVATDTVPPDFQLAPLDTITCIQPNSIIEVDFTSPFSVSGIVPGGFPFVGNNFSTTIPGLYSLTVRDNTNGCTSDTTFVIYENISIPSYTFNQPTISCSNPSGELSIESTSLFNYEWRNDLGFISNDSLIIVISEGPFYLRISDINGCEALDTFDILLDTIPPDAAIMGSMITCTDSIVNLDGVSSTSGVNYTWFDSNGFISNSQSIQVDQVDLYRLVVEGTNGCQTEVSYTPTIDTLSPYVSLPIIELNCNFPTLQIIPSLISSYQFIIWEGPNGFQSNDPQPVVSEAGMYSVELINAAGCRTFQTFEVFEDLAQPDLLLSTDSINCSATIGELNAQSTEAIGINWSGPNGFASANFTINVSQAGLYTAQVIAANGCQKDSTIEVIADFENPQLDFDDDLITCLDSVAMVGDSTLNPNWEVLWSGPNGFSSTLPFQEVVVPGNYSVVVRGENGCQSVDTIFVDVDTINIQIGLNPDTINCIRTSITLTPNFSDTPQSIEWTLPDNSNSNQTNLNTSESGNYELQVQAANGCTTLSSVHVFADTIPPTLVIDSLSLTCSDNSPMASINYSAVDPTFSWTGPNGFSAVIVDPEIIDTGLYTLTIQDENGCEIMQTMNVSSDVALPVFSVEDDSLNCIQTSILLQTDFVGDYSFEWNGPNAFFSTGPDATINVSGTYQITAINNENGCEDSMLVNVFSDTLVPQSSLADFELSCAFNQIQLQPDVVDAEWNYSWTGPSGFSSLLANPFTGIPGSYRLDIIGKNGCVLTLENLVTTNDSVPSLDFLLDTISCFDPVANIHVTADLVGTTFSWTGPNGFISFEDSLQLINAGTYEVEGTASNGCSVLSSIEILIDTLSPLFQVPDTLIDCNNPIVTINPVSILDNEYTWFDGVGAPVVADQFDVYSTGTYRVEAVGQNGCNSTLEYTVNSDFDTPTLTTTDEIINCQNDSVVLQGSTLNTLDSLYWTGPNSYFSDTTSPTVNSPGEYWLTAIGPNGCIDSLNLLIAIDTIAPQTTLLADTISCQDSLASIVALISNPNWILNWSGPAGFSSDSIIAETLIPGIYNLEVTGDNFCTNNFMTEVILDQSVPVVSVPDSFINCANPSITLAPVVSSTVDQYSWSDGVAELSIGNELVVNTGGSYFLNITADNGCEANTSFEITTDFVKPDFSINPDTINCQETSIVFDLSSNDFSEINWQGPAGFSSNILNPSTSIPGQYLFEIIADNGCDTTGAVEIFADTLPPLVTISADVLDCSVDSVLVNINGDFDEVIWTIDGDQLVTEPVLWLQQAASIEAYFIGENFCGSTIELEVTEDLLPPMFDLAADTITCQQVNAELQIIPIDPINDVLWMGPNGFSSNQLTTATSEPGWYFATMSGSNACTAQDSIFIEEDIDLPLLTVQGDTIDCAGGSFTITSSLDPEIDSYTWSGPNSFSSNQPSNDIINPGIYNLEVIGLNGCDQSYSVEVLPAVIPDRPILSGNTTLNCNSTSSQLTASYNTPNFDFEANWSLGNDSLSQNQQLNINQPGVYYFEITNLENECTSLDSIIVSLDTLAPGIQIDAINGQTITCADSSLLIEAFPSGNQMDFTFEWYLNSNQISMANNLEVDQPGTYFVALTSNLNGCTTVDSIEVDLSVDVPMVEIDGFTILNCYQPTIDLEVTHDPLANFTLNWELNGQVIPGSANSSNINIFQSGMYQVEITNQETGCTNFDTIQVNQNFAEPTLDFEQSNLIDCFNETAELSFVNAPSEFVEYWWINSGDTIDTNNSIEINGTESLTLLGVLISSGCSADMTVSLEVGNLGPENLLLSPEQPICPEDLGAITIDEVIGGVGPYLFSFENNAFENTQVYSGLSPAVYELVVQDTDGCEFLSAVEILEANPVDLELGEDETIGLGDSIRLNAQSFSNISFYNWADSTLCLNCPNPFVTPLQTTEYQLEVIDDRGCVALDRITIFVKEKPVGFIPNIFSPNNDGLNDLFVPFFSSSVEEVLSYSIYSRWGEQVFNAENSEPDNPELAWDGTLNGRELNPGVFIYRVEVLMKNGKKRSTSGDLTLLK